MIKDNLFVAAIMEKWKLGSVLEINGKMLGNTALRYSRGLSAFPTCLGRQSYLSAA